jgi:hypothetical protein
MAFYDLQVQVPVFLGALTASFQARQTCPPPPFDVDGVSVTIHRIEFRDSSIRHDKPAGYPVFYAYQGLKYRRYADGFLTQLAQNIRIHASTTDDVLNHPGGEPASMFTADATVIFNLDYELSLTPTPEFLVKYSAVEWPSPPPLPPGISPAAVQARAEAVIKEAVGKLPGQPLDITTQLTGTQVEVINAGLTVSQDQKILVFRAETGVASENVDRIWGFFYSGRVTDRLGAEQWGLWLPKSLIEITFQTKVWNRLAQNLPDEVDLISVGCHYSDRGDVAHLDTTISGHFDLPDPAGNPYVEVPVPVDLSVTSDRKLALDIQLPSVASIASHVYVGAQAAARVFLGPLWGFVAALAQSAVDDADISDDLSPGSEFICVETAPGHQHCTRPLRTPAFAGLTGRLSKLVAQPEGILLAAQMVIPSFTPPTLRTVVSPFAWTPPELSCSSADTSVAALYQSHMDEVASVQAEILLDVDGTLPVYTCDITTINDPLGLFPASKVVADSTRLPCRLTLNVVNPGPAYAAAPYPVDLVVRTTAGTRLVRIPPSPVLTDDDRTRIEAAVIGMIANCKILTAPGRFDLRWLIDPPFEKRFVERWHFVAEGFDPNTPLRLLNAGRPLLAIPRPTEVAVAFSALLSHANAALSLGSAASVSRPTARLGVRQELMEVVATIRSESRVLNLVEASAWSPRSVLSVQGDTLVHHDLGVPTQPRLLGTWQLPGLRRVLVSPARVLAATSDGVVSVLADRRLTRLGPAFEERPLLDLAAGATGVHVLTDTMLESRTDDLLPASHTPREGATTLLSIGPRLLVGSEGGIQIYRPTPGTALGAAITSLQELDVVRLEHIELAGGSAVLATVADGSLRGLSLREDDRLEVVAEYPTRPWFADAAQVGTATVVTYPDGSVMDVLLQREARQIGADVTTRTTEGFETVHWTDVDAQAAHGRLHGADVTIEGPLGTGSSTDGSFTLFGRPGFSPPLPSSDAVNLVSSPGSSFRIHFARPVRDPVLHFASLASELAFPRNTAISLVSGDALLRLTGTTLRGAVLGSFDANGTVRIYGSVTDITFTAKPVYDNPSSPDGIYVQVGALAGG